MRIVVCVKEVLDPDAVNNYALAGRLEIGEDGKSLTQTTIPRLMNGFDEQALEAALRLRDAGAECRIGAVSVGPDSATILKHAAALGVDEIASLPMEEPSPDYHVVATLLAAYVRSSGDADLVLCGRQASDDDQGVAPAHRQRNIERVHPELRDDKAERDDCDLRHLRHVDDLDEHP